MAGLAIRILKGGAAADNSNYSREPAVGEALAENMMGGSAIDSIKGC